MAAWQTEFDRVKSTPGSFDAWTALLSSTEKLVSPVCTLQLSLMFCALYGMFTLPCKLVGPPVVTEGCPVSLTLPQGWRPLFGHPDISQPAPASGCLAALHCCQFSPSGRCLLSFCWCHAPEALSCLLPAACCLTQQAGPAQARFCDLTVPPVPRVCRTTLTAQGRPTTSSLPTTLSAMATGRSMRMQRPGWPLQRLPQQSLSGVW